VEALPPNFKPQLRKSVRWNASRILPELLEDFLSHHDTVLEARGGVAELHLLRIAGKPLRYAMEAFKPIYGKEFKRSLKKVEQVIDLMGKIHDCDVVIGELGRFEKQLRKLNRSPKTRRQRYATSVIGRIIRDESTKREKLFLEFATLIRRMNREKFHRQVLDTL